MVDYLQESSITQLIERQVEQSPDAIAVIDQHQQLTYRKLNERANQLAHYLSSLGVKPETPVGICVKRSFEMVIGLLGILKAGGAYIPLDPNYPQERLAFTIEDSQLPFLLTQSHLIPALPPHQAQAVDLDNDWIFIAQQAVDNPIGTIKASNLAYVIYTSGSTGKPKGVAIEHRNTVALIEWAKTFFTREQLRGVLASTSLCFDLSIFELFVTLSCGGTVILAENALQLPSLPAASKVTLINTVPSAIAALLRIDGIPTSVHTVNLAGEPLQNALVQQLYQLEHVQQVFNLYGPSEDTTYSTVALIPKGTNTIPSIGRPISNTEIYLIETPARRKDDPLKLVPIGTPGEIYIAGAGLARGYLNSPELTAEKFIANPFSQEPRARLYKTGDLAVHLPDGNLKFLGRIDHQVKIRGFRVELGDVEAALSQYPGIREATVVAKDDASRSKRLVAYIVPHTANHQTELAAVSDQLTSDQLQQWQKIWNATYRQVATDSDPTSDSAGWIDSFTGLPMPPDEVQGWVDCTVERILSLRPQRVLEIGCGRGMLLFRIAPQCAHYFGMDISTEAIHTIEQRLKKQSRAWSHVSVAQKSAHELDEFKPKSFDMVVLNSVIQYFPSVDYLVQVLEKVTQLIAPGGQIFIGDVRNLPLLKAFHTGVQLNQAADTLSCHQLQWCIQERIAQDQELVLHSDFFSALKHHLPRISAVQIQLKRGYSNDELTRFRSDVILHVETEPAARVEPVCLDWQQQELSISKIRQLLQQHEPAALRITGVPNARLFYEVKATELLANSTLETVETLRQVLRLTTQQLEMHPEQFWALSQEFPYSVYITWSASKAEGTYDIVLQHRSVTSQTNALIWAEPPVEPKPWRTYSNHPLSAKNNLVPQLRTFLQEKLPDYMIPSAFVVMESLPLTLNGKIDRRSLPDPKKERPILAEAYVAPSTPLEQRLAEIWSEVLDIEQVGICDNFFELGGHSLLLVQLLAHVQTAIGIEIPLFYLLKEPTIAGLVKAIDAVQHLGTAADLETEGDFQADTVLDPTIYPEAPYLEPISPEHILLTGATGFLGAFLLQELLQQTEAVIYCLVRASTIKEAQQKLQTNLERYLLWSGELSHRVIPVLGDLSQLRLGMTGAEFQKLADRLDSIYHCGALVNLVYPYSALRAVNVIGTQEILRMASRGKTTPVHYVSTIDVLKPLIYSEQRMIGEDEYDENGENVDKGYTQTKWVAEKLVMAAQARGIPTCIYRPGMLTGHSQTGASQTDDLMCRIIKGMIQLEAAPELNQSVNMTPIDYASRAIVHLSRQSGSFGKSFHIINPQSLPWVQLVSQIQRFGYPIQLLPHDQWQTKLRQLDSPQANVLGPMLSLFTEKNPITQMTYLESFLVSAQAFDCRNTLAGLSQTSITCPPIDHRLLNVYFSYFQQAGFLKREDTNSIVELSGQSLIQQKNDRSPSFIDSSKMNLENRT